MVSFAHLLQNILLLSTLIISSSCYHLVYDNSTPYTWHEAQSYCQSKYGTNLATAQTQQELNELISMRDAVFDSNVYLYIGLNDQNEEGIFKWISGESCDPNADGTLCVTYWKANEPSNSGGIEHCTALIYAVNGISEIYDESCDRERNQFFCDSPSQSQYHLVYDDSTSYNWTEAQSYCQSFYGSNLATAQTQEELNELIFMRDTLFGDTNVYLFIGLNDQDEEGVFEWISGEECDPTATGTLCVTYWKANEPSNSGGNEHCTELIYPDVNNISYIYDINCDREQQQFFCDARRYYLVYDSSTTYNWDEAQTYCETRYGTNLATAKTQQELNELISMRDRVFDTNVYLFIGLNDKNEEGVFEWISGEECDPIANADGTLCVTYWKQGEPSNSGGNEHCTELIYADVNGISYIYDMSCDKEENQFFCDAIIEPTLTFQPTKSPSEQPTHYPTQVTNEPTELPTELPTESPVNIDNNINGNAVSKSKYYQAVALCMITLNFVH
eukprot:104852_1